MYGFSGLGRVEFKPIFVMPFLTDLLLLLLDRKVSLFMGSKVVWLPLHIWPQCIQRDKKLRAEKLMTESFQSIFQAQIIETQLKVL